MAIAAFLVPTREMIQMFNTGGDSRVEAVKAWRAMDHRLLDGTKVMPTVRTALDALRGYADFPALREIPLAIEHGSYTVRPWWDGMSLDEREEQYHWACEGWHERYAEPRREDYGLPPIEPPAPQPTPEIEWDEDIPF